jgi:Sulfotransferase family
MKPPVFVVGSARSGTTLLYHMLLSSGGFAIYRAETHVFNLLPPCFGDLRKEKNREKLFDFWTNSVIFKISGLEASLWKEQFFDHCTSYSKLLTFFMDSIADQQKVDRWAECTPLHLLHMKRIKQGIPGAKFIHIIRDGRDVAVSLNKLGWVKPLTFMGLDKLCTAVLRWEWTVNKGRQIGAEIGSDYTEVFFEDLLNNPEDELSKLGDFIKHKLDYKHIKSQGIGSVSKPNTAFKEEKNVKPQERWRSLTSKQIASMEALVGKTLDKLAYKLADQNNTNKKNIKASSFQLTVTALYSMKFWLKFCSQLGGYLGETPFQFDAKMFQIFKNFLQQQNE